MGLIDEQIQKHFLYTALVDYFPGSNKGSHIVPTAKEIDDERKRLEQDLVRFNPRLVVPVGKLSISKCLGNSVNKLSDVIGQTYTTDPYRMLDREVVVIPLPHPSGASNWKHQVNNRKLLMRALNILKVELKP